MQQQTEIRLTIDGSPVTAAEGQSVLESALAAGIYIPHLCHHPALKPQGGCKLCSVEIEGMEGTVTSCNTEVKNGMKVYTKTQRPTHLRQVTTELLLACHPADCTSCAAYLNCELQALLQYLGVAHSRLRRIEKRNIPLANGPMNPLIKREMERCIQCGRCVRACEELRGVGALDYLSKDGESYIGVKNGAALTESDCRFCGACVEVCPTGAIQDMPGTFQSGIPKDQALIPCKNACPAHTDIPAYLRLAEDERYPEATAVLREKLTFPNVLGHVCNHKCEADCKRGRLDSAISIRELKRFAVENDPDMMWRSKVKLLSPTGKRVAVIGAGPCGMTAAWHLARKGHAVTVIEKQPLLGGMMRYGIPEYRLNREIVDREIGVIKDIGVTIVASTLISSAPALLKADYDAVLIAVGAGKGARFHLNTDDCENVWSAVDFLRLASQGKMPDPGDSLTVLGGGNVAFDCARTAKKAGIKTVRLACLEARGSMLADDEEIREGLSEGVEILNDFSSSGLEKANGRVTAVNGVKVKSFRFGENGLELEKEPGSEQTLETTGLVLAMGQRIDLDESFGVKLGRGNSVVVDGDMQSNVPGIFAAGDAVTGTKSVVEAIASARKASTAVDLYLGGDGDIDESYLEHGQPDANIGTAEGFSKIERLDCVSSCKDASTQALRCLQCDLRLQIPKVRFWTDSHYKQGKNVNEHERQFMCNSTHLRSKEVKA